MVRMFAAVLSQQQTIHLNDMNTVNTIADLRAAIRSERMQGNRIAFVPTMGNLHAGHISLVQEAKQHGNFIVVSIFVNPMQFGENEDLDSYPRTLAEDLEKLAAVGAHLVFAPSAKEMYPRGLGSQTVVSIPSLAGKLCGQSRPVFFDGVATIVSKLFNVVQPDAAVFGQKDFQQLMVIRQMVSDLNMPVDIIGVPTAREPSGLAMSSRNGYLNTQQKQQAAQLYHTMLSTQHQLTTNGRKDFDALTAEASQSLTDAGFVVDYYSICDSLSLEPATADTESMVIITAVILNGTRLIDNLLVDAH